MDEFHPAERHRTAPKPHVRETLVALLPRGLAQRVCIGAVGVPASAIRLSTSCSVFSAGIFLRALLRFPILARETHPRGSQPSPCILKICGLVVLRNRVLNPGLRCARPRCTWYASPSFAFRHHVLGRCWV